VVGLLTAAAELSGNDDPSLLTVVLWVAVGVAAMGVATVETVRLRREAAAAERAKYEVVALWPPPLGAEADPFTLGVTPSRVAAIRLRRDIPYIVRDRDAELRTEIARCPFVLVLGESKSGKTRAVAEAVRVIFADRLVFVPASPDRLAATVELARDSGALSVVVLDDLDRYLDGGYATVALIRGLSANDRVKVVATMRTIAHDRLSPHADVEPPAWRVIRLATVVRYDRLLTPTERDRVRAQVVDRRFEAALDRYGLAEYLSAGPDLIDRLLNAESVYPVGYAIVRAAADWRRICAGYSIGTAELRECYGFYLPEGAVGDESDEFDNGVRWARERLYATSALITQGTTGLVVHDYIMDHLESHEADLPVPDAMWSAVADRVAEKPLARFAVAFNAWKRGQLAVAERLLRVVAEDRERRAVVTLNETPDAPEFSVPLNAIAASMLAKIVQERSDGEADRWQARFRAGLLQAAVGVWAVRGRRGDPYASFLVAQQAERSGDQRAAMSWYSWAAEHGNLPALVDYERVARSLGEEERAAVAHAARPRLLAAVQAAARAKDPLMAYLMGYYELSYGSAAAAEGWLRIAADGGFRYAPHTLASCLARLGRPREAIEVLRALAEHDDIEAFVPLAQLLESTGEAENALIYYRRATRNSGDGEAAFHYGTALARLDRVEEAITWLRKAINQGHRQAANNLGSMLEKAGDTRAARQLYLLGVVHGDPTAAANIARHLLAEGNTQEATKYLTIAADGGDPDGALMLAELLEEQGDFPAAAARYRDAATAHPHALIGAAVAYWRADMPAEAQQVLTVAADADVPEVAFEARSVLTLLRAEEGDDEGTATWLGKAEEVGSEEDLAQLKQSLAQIAAERATEPS